MSASASETSSSRLTTADDDAAKPSRSTQLRFRRRQSGLQLSGARSPEHVLGVLEFYLSS